MMTVTTVVLIAITSFVQNEIIHWYVQQIGPQKKYAFGHDARFFCVRKERNIIQSTWPDLPSIFSYYSGKYIHRFHKKGQWLSEQSGHYENILWSAIGHHVELRQVIPSRTIATMSIRMAASVCQSYPRTSRRLDEYGCDGYHLGSQLHVPSRSLTS